MRNILVTNYDNSGEDVMIFSERLTDKIVEKALTKKGQTFEEIYEVPTKDLQYYIYDPCHFTPQQEINIINSI